MNCYPGISIIDHINFLQRFIIVHSYIYYELSDNAISDSLYDKKSKKLVSYKEKYPKLWKSSQYYKQFGDDYNGCTGFTLYHDLDKREKEIIRSIASVRNKYRII